jgi:transposase-like protein
LTLHLGSDAHKGLTKPIRWMLRGSCRQRCRVHFAHNLLQRDPKAYQGMVTAALLSVFAQEKASRSRLPKRRGSAGSWGMAHGLGRKRPHYKTQPPEAS